MSHAQILTAARRSWFTLCASLRLLEVEYRESENSSRILRASGFWNCFWIRDIPLPKCLKLARKLNQLFCPGITEILKAAGRSWFTLPDSLRPLEVEYLELFSDSQYSTSKCLKLARKVNQLFPAGLCEDLCVGGSGGACKVYIDLCHTEYTKTPSN